MIRVLIADDSSTVRKLITQALNSGKEIEVVASVENGREAVRRVRELDPDVIIMDIHMPEMDGVQATKRIMGKREDVKPVIVVFSGYTEDKTELAYDCLEAGAFSCVEKPGGPSAGNIEGAQETLIEQVKQAASTRKGALQNMGTWKMKKKKCSLKPEFPIVLIGSSTGGPPVVEKILSEIPGSLHAAVVVVQHMPAHFTKTMAKRLNGLCAYTVKEAENNEKIKPGTVLVAPGDFHMSITQGDDCIPQVQLNQSEPIHGLRPAIDVTMQDAAAIWGEDAVGVLLTGMGHDGTVGMQCILKNGGTTIVQEPSTCVVDSMVQTAIGCDAVKQIVRPEEITKTIIKTMQHG